MLTAFSIEIIYFRGSTFLTYVDIVWNLVYYNTVIFFYHYYYISTYVG
jgi:hypothetical protein